MNTHPAHAFTAKQIAIFGATGGVGRQLVAQATAAGHSVTVLARDPGRAAFDDDGVTVVAGDATDPEAVARTLRGADAVICALGAPALSRSRVRSEGTRAIVSAMKAHGVRRIVCVSTLGAAESRAWLPFLLRRVIFPLYLRRAVADHERQEQILRGSALDWTVVRPPTLTDGPATGDYVHGFVPPLSEVSLKISRADVAHFIPRQLDAETYAAQAVAVSAPKPNAAAAVQAAPRPS